MSYSISTLLIRNLDDVFSENDPARRRAAIDEIFHEDKPSYAGTDFIIARCCQMRPRGSRRSTLSLRLVGSNITKLFRPVNKTSLGTRMF
jgi:hypothetical protein